MKEPSRTKLFSLLTTLCLISCAKTILADVELAPLFQDHAVLQHGKRVPIWGRATPGENVNVSFAGQSQITRATESGVWSVTLEPLPPSSKGLTLTVSGRNTLVVDDILVGEVWLASGQSNMGWTVGKSRDASIEVTAANWPLIREIEIKKKVANEPHATAGGTWKPASPATVTEFSAIAYFFARDLHQTLDGTPIGIINSSWGGTYIESWMSPPSLAPENGPAFSRVHERWALTLAEYPAAKEKYDANLNAWNQARDEAAAQKRAFTQRRPAPPSGHGHKDTPGGLYNGMIHPLLPYALRGVIWYQGEHNTNRADEYHAFFATLVTDWRHAFQQGDIPFLWAQLANCGGTHGTKWAFLREAQTKTLSLPHTGQAITIDIGDPNDVHPRNKQDVGRRLARLALNRVYNSPMVDSGPVFTRAEPADIKGRAGFRLHFLEINGGLKLAYAPPGQHGFEIAGADRVFKPADARLDGSTVLIFSEDVRAPIAVRYAWRDAPFAGLSNTEGLPAVPFRTDDW